MIEQIANEAIFQLQLNTEQAVKYVSRNANVDSQTALKAVRSVMTAYKH